MGFNKKWDSIKFASVMDNCNEVLMARSSVGGYGYRPKDYGLRALLMLANLYIDSVDRNLLTLDPPKSP
jgi:hypothetical protein